VFEIGTRPREARERRGLELAEVGRDTRISQLDAAVADDVGSSKAAGPDLAGDY